MTDTSFLKPDGTPDVARLITTFQRCGPVRFGSLAWLDQVRDCNGPGDSLDGRKHDIPGDPQGAAFPWNLSSNCKPFVCDDAINELAARDLTAFWRSMIQRGAGESEEAGYAVALVEHLVFGPMMARLDKEVELSTQHRHSRGWCLLAPRWRQEFGLKRFTLKLDLLNALSAQAPPESPLFGLVSAILDPTQEDLALEKLRQWYDAYVQASLPEKFRDRAPKLSDARIRKVIKALRAEGVAETPIPYLCRNEPEIVALEPWREVFIPPENNDAQDLVFHVEPITQASLEGRVLGEGYDAEWVTEAAKFAGESGANSITVRDTPAGLAGLNAGTSNFSGGLGNGDTGLINLVHAVYKAVDEDGVPGAYCTTFHVNVGKDSRGRDRIAKHEMVDTIAGELPYIELVLEWRNRAVTSSRSVQEMVATQQKLIKDVLDQIIDRSSVTISPPANCYTSVLDYKFGPGAKNYVKKDREPSFMQMPSGQGLADGVAVHNIVRKTVDNRFGLMSEDVPPSRMQTAQEKSVRRFLIAWTRAFQQVLCLYQTHGDDKEFAKITGAPEGWLEERRTEPGVLSSIFDFDVRELDAEMFREQVKAMNTVVLPNDVLGVIERGQYAAWMARGIVGPRVARSFLRTLPDASGALKDKAELQVLKMFAGTPPALIDKDDPTAASLLQYTKQNVMQNPNYLKALNDEALVALAGPQAQQLAQQLQPRQPNEIFSGLLVTWLKNLQFIGVTQQQNKQIGRTGVAPAEDQMPAPMGQGN